ncbi:MAG: hypothetical protein IT370_12020 [Deltaproteobacteria bacterium]|nr:hypothetical protein [Deltaproteobacteria bacterium]
MAAPRTIAVPARSIAALDLSKLSRSFAPAHLTPGRARGLCGKLTLTTARPAATSATPLWQDDAWRRYLVVLLKELPHFAYFLRPDGEHFVEFVLAVLPRKHLQRDKAGALAPDGRVLAQVLATLLDPVADYCRSVGDDPAEVTGRLLGGFGPIGAALRDYFR